MKTDSREEPQSVADLQTRLADHALNGGRSISVIPVLCDGDPGSALSRDPSVLVSQRDDLIKLDFLPLWARDLQPDGSRVMRNAGGAVYGAPTIYKGVWRFVTVCGAGLVKRFQDHLGRHQRIFPQFSFNNGEMLCVLDQVRDATGGADLHSTRAVMWSQDQEAVTNRVPMPYRAAFEEASRHVYTVRNIRVHCPETPHLDFTLFRDGSSRISHGSWMAFAATIQPIVFTGICRKLGLVSGRERRSFEEMGQPLDIRYSEDVFRDAEDTARLVAAFQTGRNFAVTVRHSNPYLHASVVDFVDGAQSDVFVTSSTTVSIVPGYAASQGSLLRLMRAIFDYVKEEGEVVSDPVSPRFTLRDAMGVTAQ